MKLTEILTLKLISESYFKLLGYIIFEIESAMTNIF